jgi:hypothetical protein
MMTSLKYPENDQEHIGNFLGNFMKKLGQVRVQIARKQQEHAGQGGRIANHGNWAQSAGNGSWSGLNRFIGLYKALNRFFFIFHIPLSL